MTNEQNPNADSNQPLVYQIRIKGHLSEQWVNWFDAMTISLEDNGNTLLTGPVLDQAALHGVLKKIRDAGMTLLSVNPYHSTQGKIS